MQDNNYTVAVYEQKKKQVKLINCSIYSPGTYFSNDSVTFLTTLLYGVKNQLNQ